MPCAWQAPVPNAQRSWAVSPTRRPGACAALWGGAPPPGAGGCAWLPTIETTVAREAREPRKPPRRPPLGTRAGRASRHCPCSHFRRKPGSLARGGASITITLLGALPQNRRRTSGRGREESIPGGGRRLESCSDGKHHQRAGGRRAPRH